MKQSVWGYAVLVLGIMAIMITWFFTQVTNTDQHNYNLLKETVESSMLDAVDLSAYRNDGTVRMDETKFLESFVRRFAENADLSNTYEIDIYDVNEVPPKVSLSVKSCKQANGTTCSNSGDNLTFSISNNIDAILEAEWQGEQVGDVKITYVVTDKNTGNKLAVTGSNPRSLKKGSTIPYPNFTNESAYNKPTTWVVGGKTYKITDTVLATEDTTVSIVVEGQTYTATLNNSYSSISTPSTLTYTYGVGASLPSVSNSEYSCTWKNSSGTTVTSISKTQTGNISYTLSCTKKTYSCSAGKYLPASSTSCKQCSSGYYCPGVSGVNYSSSSQGIFSCPSGYTSSAGSSSQANCYVTKTCSAGTYSSSTKAYYPSSVSCATCPANYYCTGGTNKTACPSGQTSSAGSTSSSACKSAYTYYTSQISSIYGLSYFSNYTDGTLEAKCCKSISGLKDLCPSKGIWIVVTSSNASRITTNIGTGATFCDFRRR